VMIQANIVLDTIRFGDTIRVVKVTGNYDPYLVYEWKPETGLGCSNCAQTFAAPLETTVYTITATDTLGCKGFTEFTIVVIGDYVIYVPNAFTPNKDGTNDVFKVFAQGVKTFELQVFDRWGEKLYEGQELLDGWDGYFRGKEQNPGVYVYVAHLEFFDGYKKLLKGSVTLIR